MHILRRISYYGFLALLVYMPLHVFLSQSFSVATGGLEVWKVAKDVALILLTLFTTCLVLVTREGSRLFYWLLGLAVAYGLLHLGLWATHTEVFHESALLGIVYNNRLPCLLLVGFGAAVLNRDKFVFSSVLKIILGMSTLIALLGVLQYLLPKDILSHLGYSLERGARPAFFIDDNPALPRIMSTLREPNALGAYLIVPISLLIMLAIRFRDTARRLMVCGALALHLLALLLTFSRSAWLGTVVAVLFVLWWSYRNNISAAAKRLWPIAATAILIVGIGIFLTRNTPFFQQYIVHSDPSEVVADLDSNDYHMLLIHQGLEGVASQPLGHGPGTAGLASIRDPAGGQLTENYYIQIAYEVGLVGLAIFLTLLILVYWQLWQRKDWLAVCLLAAFWGYVGMNLLLHTWSNEAVAAQWWLLAGAAIAGGRLIPSEKSISTKKHADV